MKTVFKRWFALFLTVITVAASVPMDAFASEVVTADSHELHEHVVEEDVDVVTEEVTDDVAVEENENQEIIEEQLADSTEAVEAEVENEEAVLEDMIETQDIIFDVVDTPYDTTIASGKCGKKSTYVISGGMLGQKYTTLTIKGTGDFESFRWLADEEFYEEYAERIGEVVIEDGITSIPDEAFSEFENLRKVNIPNSVTSIGYDFIYDCPIDYIVIPKSVKNADGALSGSLVKTVLFEPGIKIIPENSCCFAEELKSVIIPEGVEIIETCAFESCGNLKSIELPDSLAEIEYYAFAGTGLESLEIPGNVTYLGDDFISGTKIPRITVPKSVKKANSAFYGSQIQTIEFENGMTTIPEAICSDMAKLNQVILPSSIEKIEDDAFAGCKLLKSINLPEGLKYIGSFAFAGTGFTSLKLPKNVISLGEEFISGSAIKEITIPASVTDAYCALYNSKVEEVIFEEGITKIPEWICYGAKKLEKVTIPEGVSVIESNAFDDCDYLYNITLPDSLVEIGPEAFLSSGLKAVDLPKDLKEIGECAFAYTKIVGLHLPKGLTDLGRAFIEGCKISELLIPKGLVNAEEALLGSNVVTVEFEDGIEKIPNGICYEAEKLKDVVIPDSVKVIGQNAFDGCLGLTSVELPEGLVRIEKSAFYYCDNIKTFKFRGSKNQWENVVKEAYWDDEIGLYDVIFGKYDITIVKNVNGTITVDKIVAAPGEIVTVTAVGKNCYGNPKIYVNDKLINGNSFVAECDSIVKVEFSVVHTVVTTPAKEATCTENGLTEGQHCSVCGVVIQKQEPTVALGHDYEGVKTAPTCDAQGYTTYTCKRSGCGHSYVSNYVPALGHAEVVDKGKEATCTQSGLTDGKHCSRCNKVLVAQQQILALGHDVKVVAGKEATCTKDGLTEGQVCSRTACKKTLVVQEVIPALGHDYKTEVTKATCEEKGYTTYTCKRTGCGESYKGNEVNALGHAEVVDKGKAATCTQTGLTEGKHCSRCSKIFVKQEVIPALDHKWDNGVITKEATATEPGNTRYTCIRENCGAVKDVPIPVCEHVYKTKETKATCEDDGYTTYTCKKCNYSYKDNVVKALGHDVKVITGKKETCTTDGLTEGQVCTRKECKKTLVEQVVIPAPGHTIVVDMGYDATCEADGYTEGTHCSVCEKILTAQKVIPAFGHKWDAGVIIKEVTSTEEGIIRYTCENCGKVDDKLIPICAHSYTKKVTKPTCEEEGYTTYTCKKCKYSYNGNTVDALGHDIKVITGKPATCTKDGLTEGQVCKRAACKKMLAEQVVIPALGHEVVINEAVEPTCTEKGLTEGSYCSVCKEVFTEQKEIDALGHQLSEPVENEDGTKTAICEICGEEFIINEEITDLEVLESIEIELDRDYIMAELEECNGITATMNHEGVITWSVEGDSVTIDADNTYCEFEAAKEGTSYIVASAYFGDYAVYARCRVDVTEEEPINTISAAHLPETTVTSKIYSSAYAEFDVHFDLAQNMMATMDGNGLAVEEAYFATSSVRELFDLEVVDDRTLAIVPAIDLDDAEEVKAIKSSYKTKVTLVVNGEEITTEETLTLKTDKKLPTVKVAAVKLNGFYTGDTKELVFTSKDGIVESVSLDADMDVNKVSPSWLELNDKEVSLCKAVSSASGKLYLDVYMVDYEVPVKAVAAVSVSSSAPKLKLSSAKATFNTYRENATDTTLTLLSNDNKVKYETIGVKDITVAYLEDLSDSAAKTYAASENYEVTSFDEETGVFTINVLQGKAPVAGKVLLKAAIEGSEQTVNLALTVSVYTKTPTFKLEKTNVKLSTENAMETSLLQVKVLPTPADYVLTDENFTYVVKDAKNKDVTDDMQLYVHVTNNVATVRSTKNTVAGAKYKVVFTLKGAAKPVTLNVTVTAPTLKLSKTSVTLNKLIEDWAYVNLTTNPADYILDKGAVAWEIKDSKNKILTDQPLDVTLEGNALKVAVNDKTAYGATYKVVLKMKETGKETTLTVKTLAENKSEVKLSISAKGSLQTGYLDKGVVITPKWTNLTNGADLSGNIKVYAKETAKGAVAMDVTDKFDISVNETGTYTLKFKDAAAVSALNPKAKYTVVAENVVVKGVEVADSKAISVTMTLTKAKVTQSTKTVKLYLNDKYSQGIVKLSMNDKTLSKIGKVELVESKTSEFYELKDLGNGQYAICFKNSEIVSNVKDGTLKLNVYLEGNTAPNAAVSVKVTNVKFGK